MLLALLLSYCSEHNVEIPTPPYINEDGSVDWDKKLKHDLGEK
jgi:hypothetical protein